MEFRLTDFGSFPNPYDFCSAIRDPLLFLIPPPSSYMQDFKTYLSFLELSGGCTCHYIEKGKFSHLLLMNKKLGKTISHPG